MKKIFLNQIDLEANETGLVIRVDDKIVGDIPNCGHSMLDALVYLEAKGYEINEDNFEVFSMKSSEQMYTYRLPHSIANRSGLIGHLRADIDNVGGFFSDWTDHSNSLKSDEFKDDLGFVIDSLRGEDCMFDSLDALKRYCSVHPDAAIKDSRGEYGVRVDTNKYSYMMRLIPKDKEYNLYCFCYEKKSLNEYIDNSKNGIRFIDSNYKELFRIANGDSIKISNELDTLTFPCYYIDNYHTVVGNNVYHICEFAEKMESAHNRYEPERPLTLSFDAKLEDAAARTSSKSNKNRDRKNYDNREI